MYNRYKIANIYSQSYPCCRCFGKRTIFLMDGVCNKDTHRAYSACSFDNKLNCSFFLPQIFTIHNTRYDRYFPRSSYAIPRNPPVDPTTGAAETVWRQFMEERTAGAPCRNTIVAVSPAKIAHTYGNVRRWKRQTKINVFRDENHPTGRYHRTPLPVTVWNNTIFCIWTGTAVFSAMIFRDEPDVDWLAAIGVRCSQAAALTGKFTGYYFTVEWKLGEIRVRSPSSAWR